MLREAVWTASFSGIIGFQKNQCSVRVVVEIVLRGKGKRNMNALRKKLMLIFTVLVCALCMLPKENIQAQDLVIVLDPGHGGEESGADRKLDGKWYREAEINMKLANYCKAELETYAGVKVYLTRSRLSQAAQGRETRLNIAKKKHADALVSFHINAVREGFQTSATGAYALVPLKSHFNTVSAQTARELAKVILKELHSQTGLKNNGFWPGDDFGIITFGQKSNYTASQARQFGMTKAQINTKIPSMIIEHCFVDNKNDLRKHLKTNAQIKKMAVADATGIAKYYGLQKKSSTSTNSGNNSTQNDKTPVTTKSGIVKKGKSLYLYDTDGTVRRGLVKYNKHYYFAGPNGKLQTGWKKIGTKKYYFDRTTAAARTGFQTIGKNKYYFTSKGVMRIKWVTMKGKRYYFSKVNGKLLTHYWLKYNDKWYRLDRNGTPLVNCTRKIGKKTYTFNKKGVCTNK